MTELSFLIELLLKHELPMETTLLVAERIKEVEQNLQAPKYITNIAPMAVASSQTIMGVPQAPSTLAALAKHGLDVPVENIAQTPQTTAALANRATVIADAQKGVTTSSGGKRKW